MYSSTGPGKTERLYYTDAYLREFTARVAAATSTSREGSSATHVVLDRTAFFPTSGGQPHDTGVLAGAPVVDVIDADDQVIHVLGGAPPAGEGPPEGSSRLGDAGIAVGAEVRGVVDWERRFDHMQQHTAQHVLSAVFLSVLGAETVSVHLGESSTLDLAIPALRPEEARRVEEAANAVVFENRPVTVRFLDAAEAESLGLRRPPRRAGMLRIVEVADCDRSACGGTHVRSTAEIGPVAVRGWERTRGQVRVEFLAGWRALRDYWWKHALVGKWSARLGTRDRDLDEGLNRLAAQAQERDRALQEARRRLLGYEAAERLAAGPAQAEPKVLRVEVPQRAPDEVRMLLREMTGRGRCVVLAGDPETGRLYFSRSPGDGPDMAALLGRICAAEGGRGGGTAEFAQGAVPGGAVARALSRAEEEIGRA